MQSKISIVRIFLNLKGLCSNLGAFYLFHTALYPFTRRNQRYFHGCQQYYTGVEAKSQIFPCSQGFCWLHSGCTLAPEGLGRIQGHRRSQLVLPSWNHSWPMARRVLTFSGVYRCSEIFKRDISSAVCFIFKCQETLPPKSVPGKPMKL